MAGPFALWSDVKTLLAAKLAKPLNTSSDGQVLTADSSSTVGVSWKAPTGGSGGGSATVSDATADTKGVVRLGGDLAGTADSPVLKPIRANAVTVGDSDSIPQITVGTDGRVTGATEVALTLSPDSVGGFDERVRDVIATMLESGEGIALSNDDAKDRLTIAATGSGAGGSADSNLVSLRRQNADGTYSTDLTFAPDTVLWWVGTTVPDSANPAVRDDALFSLLDASS